MYHLELRQFPHNLWRFNLSEQQLRAIVEPWASEQWVELGERKWSLHQAKLTILEGPQMPVQQLSMGRGWRNAQRRSEDVTERVLAAARQASSVALQPPAAAAPPSPSPDLALLADSLGLELLALLDSAPAPLSQVWRLAHARFPERPAAECLALAERAVRSLLRRRLIVLLPAAARAGDGVVADDTAETVKEQDIEPALRAFETWAADGASGGLRMRKI
jgi:hypothetical protein